MHAADFRNSMRDMIAGARHEELGPNDRWVFVSDFHLGDGSKKDDFKHNADLVQGALESYYLAQGVRLVLNGDIEELHKFKPGAIKAAHAELYTLFHAFERGPGLVKILGNHDLGLLLVDDHEFALDHVLALNRGDGTFLAYHGHQSSEFFMRHNYLSDFIVRYIAGPLKIRNADIPMTSRRRFKAERCMYHASRDLGVISIVGHTHRPLFESFSKYDTLRWRIETFLRRYADASAVAERAELAFTIGILAAEFKRLTKHDRKRKVTRSLYAREELLLPYLFNSGCATGKTGFTAIELDRERMSLVYWTRAGGARTYLERMAPAQERPAGTPWVRYTVASDSIEYIMARVKLLS